MDTHTKDLIDKILNTTIGGWQAKRYIDRGASALVFEATHGSNHAALKVFDPLFLDRYDSAIQVERINRQLTLKGHNCPHLIQLHDGGLCRDTGLYFVAMDLIIGSSLDKALLDIPPSKVASLIEQIATAARFLESRGIVHRDIKPANISIDPDFARATLLDLGVIRPVGASELTDSTDEKEFVGTARYSPPEFLIRNETDTPAGWRAVTFYQLGAVLHDMLTKTKLFESSRPKNRLIRDILLQVPSFPSHGDAPSHLFSLARACLVKDPERRIALVSWESFGIQLEHKKSVESLLADLRGLEDLAKSSTTESRQQHRSGLDRHRRFCTRTIEALRDWCTANNHVIPPKHLKPTAENAEVTRVTISFPPSSGHGTFSTLECEFRFTLLDTSIDAIQVDVASTCKMIDAPTPDLYVQWQPVYNGIAVEAVLECMQKAICASLVRAIALDGLYNDSQDLTRPDFEAVIMGEG